MYYGSNQNTQTKAVDLRSRRTDAELDLWEAIRSKKMLNAKFRQQHPIDRFIVDFYCHEIKLVIELDGEIHNTSENKDYDESRTEVLNNLGITVIRFTNLQIKHDLKSVLEKIEVAITNRRNINKTEEQCAL